MCYHFTVIGAIIITIDYINKVLIHVNNEGSLKDPGSSQMPMTFNDFYVSIFILIHDDGCDNPLNSTQHKVKVCTQRKF